MARSKRSSLPAKPPWRSRGSAIAAERGSRVRSISSRRLIAATLPSCARSLSRSSSCFLGERVARPRGLIDVGLGHELAHAASQVTSRAFARASRRSNSAGVRRNVRRLVNGTAQPALCAAQVGRPRERCSLR
jgi:hypothetical protein